MTEPRVSNKTRPALATPYTPPNGSEEKALAMIWKRLLEIDEVGALDNFYALGGDAEKMDELITRVENLFHIKVHATYVKDPTIRSLAGLIIASQKRSPRSTEMSPEKKALLKKRARVKEREFLLTPEYLITRILFERSDFETAMRRVAKLARSPIFKLIFSYSRSEFQQWYRLTGSTMPFEDAFEGYLHNNLVNYLPFDRNFERKPIEEFLRTTQVEAAKFQRTLSERMYAIDPREDDAFFQMKGLEHLTNALDKGKGVILVTYHGNVRFAKFMDIEWISGAGTIEVISFNLGTKARYSEAGELTEADHNASNAGVALDARRQLAEGKALFILSDTKDQRSKNYYRQLLGKRYPFKTGFAELSLLTGAAIVPVFKYLTRDGCPVTEFQAPLTTNKPDREEKVSDLLDQYVDFIAHCFKEHPEAMRRQIIKEHVDHN